MKLENGSLAEWIEYVDDIVWGPCMLFLLLGTGVYLMIRLRFLPLRNLRYALLCTIGKEKKDSSEKTQTDGKGVSSFSALTTELAATIGTGNIVGVSTAMVLGGPGALFWMMIAGIFGMATKLVESMLSVKYRSRNEAKEYVGGPMYTLSKALPNARLGKMLGMAFAVFAILASFGMGNMTQSNSISETVNVSFGIAKHHTGLVITIITILAVIGGIATIANVTKILVPVMGIVYMVGTLLVIVNQLHNIPSGIMQIVGMAFCPQAVGGGVCGQICVSVMESVRWGVSRGIFSNEAGLGAGGISAASACTDDYIKQGYISMTSVFLDTMVICLVTGLAIAASGLLGTVDEYGCLLTGTTLVIEVFKMSLGSAGATFISICIILFAFATIVGWAYQGERAFEFLFGRKYCMIYRLGYSLITFVGAVCSLQLVWDFSDICNALMAVPNLICVLWLSGKACKEITEYEKR
ncbi:MAG: sodium:alanine symporter family protein [Lachnospira sp.]|nr:sodium:alanine symporter family protein [Lachnospira sp.]